ncbi:hypothetical protein C5748_16295 [Phyllobacterium phragmitis]|uniref:DUF2303 domain-containing protein n=1 Tax=Phyllobacterium phragmitis TaxID=2670329 RepID=A0A2S9IPA1_9HYPH|nr:DUF2303 family protein [Phyllobacterium phragmitis]PRD42353.1 hypothetical protein C5748_16295 [Phyllobacterium phragmitis]
MSENNPATEAAIVADPAFSLSTAAELGARANGAELVNVVRTDELTGLPASVPALLIRGDNPHIRSVDAILEEHRLFPARKSGIATAQTLESFIGLTNRHKIEDSVVFANTDWIKPSLTTVIDYHENTSGGKAAFGKHRVHYAFPLSEEWKAWVKLNSATMTQEDFAVFLEEHVFELSAPEDGEKLRYEREFATTIATPAQLVELSRGLQVNVAAKVKNASTLQTGEGQIIWEEEHQGSDGKPIKVPGLFILSVAPFFMGEKVRVPVRLRYRVKSGSIVWFYQIFRPDQIINERVRTDLFDVKDKTSLPAFEGSPEMLA